MIRTGTAVLVNGSVKVHDDNIVDGAVIALAYMSPPLQADSIETGGPPHVKGFVITALASDGSPDITVSGPVQYMFDDGT